MHEFLMSLCSSGRSDSYALDVKDAEFYLHFTPLENDPHRTSVWICKPDVVWNSTLILPHATKSQLLRFLFSLGIERLSADARRAMYDSSNILRTESYE